MTKKTSIFGLWVILSLLTIKGGQAAITGVSDLKYLLKDPIEGGGGRLSWSAINNQVIYDRVESNLYFKIWTMDRDGNNRVALTGNSQLLPALHHGNPEWHPSGDFFALQVLNPNTGDPYSGTILYRIQTGPETGVQNDLWIMKKDGSAAWKITNVQYNQGVLHPHFSKDGSKLIWSEKTGLSPNPRGTWAIKLADFSIVGGIPVVANITTLTPGNQTFYETHGFSPDGSTILFTILSAGGTYQDYDLCSYHLETKEFKMLTDPAQRQWDEHGHFTSDGKQVLWASSTGNPLTPEEIAQGIVKTDYWIMNRDGSNKTRLTFFNAPTQAPVVVSDFCISPDGKEMFALIQDQETGFLFNAGSIIRMTLVNPDADDDGLLDAWEMGYFGDLAQKPEDDPDGDGFSNLQEQASGTHPKNSGDRLVLASQEFSSGAFTIQWKSVLGKVYQIEYSSNMSDWTVALNNWVATSTLSGWTDDGTLTGSPPDLVPRRFYRVRIL